MTPTPNREEEKAVSDLPARLREAVNREQVAASATMSIPLHSLALDAAERIAALEKVAELAKAHHEAEEVMLGLISIGGFNKRDAAAVARWVETSIGAALEEVK